MFTIDFTSRVPIYEQICNNVIRLASAGVFKSGDRLPPVRTVAKEIGVNPNTVAKAYRTLEIDGYIYSTVGRGTFMTDKLTKDTAYRDMALKHSEKPPKMQNCTAFPANSLLTLLTPYTKEAVRMIEVNHITKRFGKVTAVDDFTLDINRGSVLGIVGSNGGGKSTLLRILSGVFDADSGEVKINGQNIYNNPSVKGECFFIPDFPYFSNSATLENTAYLYRSLYPNWNENAFRQFCSVFPIDPDAKIIDMSKGMQRQAALILAISTCPRYLLLDEIFDGLDPVVRRLVKKILIDNVSANDMTVVIASHNLRELEELCDRICLIHKGKLLLEREIDEIKLGLRKVQVAFTEVPDNSFFEEINVINLWRNGNIFNLTIRGTEDEFMPKLEERKPLYISAVPMTLEEIFISEMGAAGYDAENII